MTTYKQNTITTAQNDSQKWLNECMEKVAVGEWLPSQYAAQCWIAYVEKTISSDEYDFRLKSIPFSPLLLNY